MAAPIFLNSSYFIVYGTSPDFFENVRQAGLRHQARLYTCRSRGQFLETVLALKTPAGVFLDGKGLSGNDIAEFNSKLGKTPVCIVQVAAGLDDFFASMVPKKLDAIALDAANAVFPQFFPALKAFKIAQSALENADYAVNFSISAGDIIGQSLLKVRWDEVCKMFPDAPKNRGNGKILDLLKESMNQCSGKVVHAILRLHPKSNIKVGLPMVFDLLEKPRIESIKYFPSAHIVDEGERFGISLGFINLTRAGLFDLSAYAQSQSGDDIEFL